MPCTRAQKITKEADGTTFGNCMAETIQQSINKRSYDCALKLSKFDKKILKMTRQEFINMSKSATSTHTLPSTSTLSADITNIVETKTVQNNTASATSSSNNNNEGSSSVTVDRSRTVIKKKRPKKKRSSKSLSTTPLHNDSTSSQFEMITPKVKPGTPLVMMRRPKFGELVFSVSGSPVLAGRVLAEERPNINIPLPNGTVISMQPENGLRRSQVPDLDRDVMEQVELLRKNLEILSQTTSQYL